MNHPISIYSFTDAPLAIKQLNTTNPPYKHVVLVPAGNVQDLVEAMKLLERMNIKTSNYAGLITLQNVLHRAFLL